MIRKHIVSIYCRLMQIERRIEAERKRPAPDGFILLRLKKLRLMLKDRVARLVQGQPELAYARIPAKGGKR